MANGKGEIELSGGSIEGLSADEIRANDLDIGGLARESQQRAVLEQLRAQHIGEIRPLETLADSLRTVPGVNS